MFLAPSRTHPVVPYVGMTLAGCAMDAARKLIGHTRVGLVLVDRGPSWCGMLGPYAVWVNGGILPSAVGMWREP